MSKVDYEKRNRKRAGSAVPVDRAAIEAAGRATTRQLDHLRALLGSTKTDMEISDLMRLSHDEANELIGHLDVLRARRAAGKEDS